MALCENLPRPRRSISAAEAREDMRIGSIGSNAVVAARGRPDGGALRHTFVHRRRPADPTDLRGCGGSVGFRIARFALMHCYPQVRKAQFIIAVE
jgi:hypothetical protein